MKYEIELTDFALPKAAFHLLGCCFSVLSLFLYQSKLQNNPYRVKSNFSQVEQCFLIDESHLLIPALLKSLK
jgi:hypothetical protein